jgi:hypothetical protein
LSIPNPDIQEEGFASEASDLLVAKTPRAPKIDNVASDKTDRTDDNPAKPKGNEF